MFTKEQGKKLLSLARQSIESNFSGNVIDFSEYKKEFPAQQGVFVTITIKGELRGCIGFPEPVYPLYKAVNLAAQAAAFEDPRFPSLKKDDFPKIKIEISVLTVPQLIEVKKAEDYIKRIKIGEDGLIIRGELGSGLLLPQVFTDYNCDAKKAMEMICQKAGLKSDEWKDLSNKIYKFQAQIFEEE